MGNLKISELQEQTSINSSDYLVVSGGGVNKKISGQTLIDTIDNECAKGELLNYLTPTLKFDYHSFFPKVHWKSWGDGGFIIVADSDFEYTEPIYNWFLSDRNAIMDDDTFSNGISLPDGDYIASIQMGGSPDPPPVVYIGADINRIDDDCSVHFAGVLFMKAIDTTTKYAEISFSYRRENYNFRHDVGVWLRLDGNPGTGTYVLPMIRPAYQRSYYYVFPNAIHRIRRVEQLYEETMNKLDYSKWKAAIQATLPSECGATYDYYGIQFKKANSSDYSTETISRTRDWSSNGIEPIPIPGHHTMQFSCIFATQPQDSEILAAMHILISDLNATTYGSNSSKYDLNYGYNRVYITNQASYTKYVTIRLDCVSINTVDIRYLMVKEGIERDIIYKEYARTNLELTQDIKQIKEHLGIT